MLVFFALTASNSIATLVSLALLGGFGFATVPGLQMRVMHFASTAPTLASGANIGAFNLGNALGGAWLGGGVTITAGLGYTSPIWLEPELPLPRCWSCWRQRQRQQQSAGGEWRRLL